MHMENIMSTKLTWIFYDVEKNLLKVWAELIWMTTKNVNLIIKSNSFVISAGDPILWNAKLQSVPLT